MNKIKYNREKIREKYKILFKYSLDYIYVNDLRGNILDANDVALKGFGYSEEELKNLNFKDLVANKEELVKAIERTMEIRDKGRNLNRTEYALKKKEGSILYVETYGIPLKEGNTVYAVLGIGTDVTERKLAQEKLIASEQRYKHLFEESPFAIAILDSKGVGVDCNSNFEEITGYHKSFFIGRHFKELPLIKPEDLPALQERFYRLKNHLPLKRMEIELRRKDGTTFWSLLDGALLKWKNEILVQVIYYDITDQKAAEELINKQIEKLRALDQLRKDLMMRVSHELKTPLTLIQTGIEYLREIKPSNIINEGKEILTTIERASTRLNRLVQNLIDAIKVDYNKLQLNPERIDFVKLVKESIDELEYLITNQHLQLKVQLPNKLITSADELRIKQVIMNILLNAIKNTPPEGIIEIAIKEREKSFELSMKDTGVGLTFDELAQLFTPFGKIERSGIGIEGIDIQGSGLGLYISKSIVELHNGTILANSKGRNKGAEFIICLPKT